LEIDIYVSTSVFVKRVYTR